MNTKKNILSVALFTSVLISSVNVVARDRSEITIDPQKQILCSGANGFKILLSKVEESGIEHLGWRDIKLWNMPLVNGSIMRQVVETTVMPCQTMGSSSPGCSDLNNVFENSEYGWYLQVNIDAGDIQVGPKHYKISCHVDSE